MIRTTILHAHYLGAPPEIENVVTEDEWITFCSTLCRQKIQWIQTTLNNLDAFETAALPINMNVPYALKLVVDGLSACSVLYGCTKVYPVLPALAAHEQLPPDIDRDTLFNALNFIIMANSRAIINVGTCLRNAVTKHPWYALQTTNADVLGYIVADGNIQNVIVRSTFSEATNVSVLIAALVQSNLTGILPAVSTPLVTYGIIDAIDSLRREFSLFAGPI